MSQLKIYVCGLNTPTTDTISWLDNAVLSEKMKDADLVLFPDHRFEIPPEWYGDERHVFHRPSGESQNRIEWHQLKEVRKLKKPVIGVGRGAFAIAAYEGCKIIQYCFHHRSNHKIHTINGDLFWVNSDHSNLIYPYNLKEKGRYELLAYYLKETKIYNENGPKLKYENGNRKEFFHGRVPISLLNNFKEPEVIWFPKTKSLAISFDPSKFSSYGIYKEAHAWLKAIIKEKLTNNITCKKESELSVGPSEQTVLELPMHI